LETCRGAHPGIRDCDDAMMETIVVPLRADLKQPLRW